MNGILVLKAATDLDFSCYDFNASDHIESVEITALKEGVAPATGTDTQRQRRSHQARQSCPA